MTRRDTRRERIVATLLLCAMLALELTYAGLVLRPDRSGAVGGSAWESLAALKPNSIDVIYLGSSHAFTGIDPAVVWRRQGIPSFVHGGPSQRLEVTEYYLREALRTQKPKVAVLEMAPSSYTDRTFSASFHASNIGLMPWGANKLAASWKATPPNMRVNVLSDVWAFHGRWDGLEKRDFELVKKRKQATFLKGMNPNTRTRKVESTPYVLPAAERDDAAAAFERNAPALRRIAALCEENDVELLLVLTPTGPPGSYSYYLERGAKELSRFDNVRALDLSAPGAVPTLSYDSDFVDAGHLAWSGADKTSRVLADYLAETYDLPNRREDPAYRSWDKDAAERDAYIVRRGGVLLPE